MNLQVLFGLFMLILRNHEVIGFMDDVCHDCSCPKGPQIRFSFRIRDKQPKNCSYPGFDLSCAESGYPLLELPNSVKLHVDHIDYVKQELMVSDTDGCLSRKARYFTLSGSAFKWPSEPYDYSEFSSGYALFSCPTQRDMMYYEVTCLSSPGNFTYAIPSYSSISSLPITYCTKLYNASSLPKDFFTPGHTVRLNWSVPDCVSCEKTRRRCGFKANVTNSKPQCRFFI